MTTSTKPACPICGRVFETGVSWLGSNFCKAAFLLPVIAENPGITAWNLSELVGLPYESVSKALQKAREWELLTFTQEERDQGGTRYHYTVTALWRDAVEKWRIRGLI